MCGIAGTLRFDGQSPAPQRLEAMLDRITHRGPDGRGIEHLGPCAMAHTRLSIIDLLGGDQPMRVPSLDKHGELTLVFNGEIYNHRELRQRLEQRGHRFTSDHSDTEALLFGYREWGLELPKHLHGMFAFAVWDAKHRTLFLCRDRVGKKPLYLHRNGRGVVFSSLISAVVAGMDSTPSINREALSEYLTFGYTMGRPLLAGVEQLPAGHWMLIHDDGRTESKQYWQPMPLSRTSTKLGAVAAIDELLNEAVAARMEADVPLGCFLSGGIDSSLIAAIAARHIKGGKLLTFNVAMPDERYDESSHARHVARHIGAEHRALGVRPDAEQDLLRLIASSGEPFADSSILPTYWLSRAAKQYVTVALSGDGGDELFGGYERYRALRLIRRWRALLRLIPSGLLDQRDQKATSTKLARLIRAAAQPTQQRQYLDMVRLFSPQHLGRLGHGICAPVDEPLDWEVENDPAEAARRWDVTHYLPFDLLSKVDRASMAVALEVRCPMLDTQVVDLAAHLPLAVLTPGGRLKGLLRQVAAKYLPSQIVHRSKMGFALPIGEWFKNQLDPLLRRWLLDVRYLPELGFNLAAIERMINEHVADRTDHTHRLFALLSLSMWMDWLRKSAAD